MMKYNEQLLFYDIFDRIRNLNWIPFHRLKGVCFTAKIGKQICTSVMNNFYCCFNVPLTRVLIRSLLPCLPRAINAGKSALNEDQARCEVLVIKRKPGANPTSSQVPMTRRRSSLPNGEGVDPLGCSVSEMTEFILRGSFACALWHLDTSKWWMSSLNKHVIRIFPLKGNLITNKNENEQLITTVKLMQGKYRKSAGHLEGQATYCRCQGTSSLLSVLSPALPSILS